MSKLKTDNTPLETEEGEEEKKCADENSTTNEIKIAELEKTVADLKDQLLRALADIENMRKRAAKEKEDALKYGITNFARELLAVSDNFERALSSLNQKTLSEDMKAFVDGIVMTQNQLINTFQKFGIKTIETEGKPFDSTYHQAVFEVEDDGKEPGTIAQVMQNGYMLEDRLLRPAMVGVVKKK